MGGRRLEVIRMVASRLTLRNGRPPRSVIRMLWGSAALMVGGTLGLLVWSDAVWLVAVVGVSALLLLTAVALRLFPIAMAVSVIGVALSGASLMTVLAVTTGFEREILRGVARLNGHVLLTKYGLDFFEYEAVCDRWRVDPRVAGASPFAFSMVAVVKTGKPKPRRQVLTDEDALLADVPEETEPEQSERGPSVVIGKGIDPVRAKDLVGLPELFDLEALRPADSRWQPGIVLGQALAHEVGAEVGDYVRIVVPAEIDGNNDPSIPREPRHATFEVLDTLHTGTSELDRNLVLVHLTAAQALFFREGRVTGIEFQLTDPELADVVASQMQEAMGYPYRLSTWRESNEAILVGIEQIRAGLSVVLGLMVIVAASSLIASLLLIVRRKQHDIAVILATGGDPSLVFWMFEAIGLLAGVTGAILGIALGSLFCFIVHIFEYPLVGDIYPVDHLPVLVSPVDALGPALVAVILCGCASGPVAVLASKTRLVAGLGR